LNDPVLPFFDEQGIQLQLVVLLALISFAVPVTAGRSLELSTSAARAASGPCQSPALRVKLRVPPGISTAVKLGLTIGQEKGYRNGDLCIDVIDVTR
jgi:hypothetical protein